MGEDVAVDGVIGPQTEAAAQAARVPRPPITSPMPTDRAAQLLLCGSPMRGPPAQVRAHPAGGKGGWIRRAEAFIAPRYHLTETEFRERVAAW